MRKRKLIGIILAVLLALLLIIVVPIAINECYKSGLGYSTVWSGSDVLSYYGNIISSAVTLVGLVITIQFTRKQIRRESRLKSESEKWAKTEQIFSHILNEINPMPILKRTMDNGFTEPVKAINIMQKYQISCRTATDELNAYLSIRDYPKVKELLDSISVAAEKLFQASQNEIDQYNKLLELKRRDVALKIISMEKQNSGAFSAKELAESYETVQSTENIRFEDIENTMNQLNEKMLYIYETDFKDLLRRKGATFEMINLEILKNADEIMNLQKK